MRGPGGLFDEKIRGQTVCATPPFNMENRCPLFCKEVSQNLLLNMLWSVKSRRDLHITAASHLKYR